jgi:hypothetical protein
MNCSGAAITYSEVLIGEVYVQIKQVGGEDLTDRILRGLYLR